MIIPTFQWGDIISRTGEDVAVVLTDSQQYILMQLLSFLQQNPEQVLTDTADYDIADIDLAIWQTMNALLDNTVVSQWKQSKILILPEFKVTNTGTFSWISSPSQGLGGYFGWVTPGINNSVEWTNIAIKKGVWYAKLYGNTNTNMGIATMQFSGTDIVNMDMYSSTSVENVMKISGNFTVSADTVIAALALKMKTKNASSSNYQLRLTALELERVSD